MIFAAIVSAARKSVLAIAQLTPPECRLPDRRPPYPLSRQSHLNAGELTLQVQTV